MKIVKLYEVKLNISAVELYQGLLDDSFLLNKVRHLYEGKCLFSSLILTIRGIPKKSGFYCSKSRNDGSTDIDLCFEAESLVYQKGDIIVGCEIKHIDRSGQIICSAPHAIIQLERDRRIQGLGMGKTIPVMVERAGYSIGKSQITVTGIPYFHSSDFILYQVKNIDNAQIPGDDIMVLQKLADNIKAEVDLVKILDTKQYEFFNKLFYPFKGDPDKRKNEKYHDQIKLVDLMDFIDKLPDIKAKKPKPPKPETKTSIKSPKPTKTKTSKKKGGDDVMFLMRHPVLLKSESMAFSVDPSFFRGTAPKVKLLSEDYNIIVETDDYVSVLYTLLSDHYNYLKMIRLHCEFYTEEKLKQNDKVWNLYQTRKK